MAPNSKQAFLGILMLDTRFPRIAGDAGNIHSYAIPARTAVVTGAESLDIVMDGLPSPNLVKAFIHAAKQLESEGAIAIVSTCGFLVSIQNQIANAVTIPVLLSALSLHPQIRAAHQGKPIGILTASRKDLGQTALKAANVNFKDAYVEGMEDCRSFNDAILKPKAQQALEIDCTQIEGAVVKKAQNLLQINPNIAAFLLECGNLPPYSDAIKRATGRPVYSIIDGANDMIERANYQTIKTT